MIRALTTFSKTNYFVDRGTQRGVVYDAFRLFEEDLNTKLESKHVRRVHLLFAPVARDELTPGLLDGRGDVAATNLTITPERLKPVDFTDPTKQSVPEIVVTGSGAPPIKTVDDLRPPGAGHAALAPAGLSGRPGPAAWRSPHSVVIGSHERAQEIAVCGTVRGDRGNLLPLPAAGDAMRSAPAVWRTQPNSGGAS